MLRLKIKKPAAGKLPTADCPLAQADLKVRLYV
jgi:hypothetical protein